MLTSQVCPYEGWAIDRRNQMAKVSAFLKGPKMLRQLGRDRKAEKEALGPQDRPELQG